MAGWCCCDHWEHWPNWKPQDFDDREAVAARSDVPPAQPSQPGHVAERQRQSAAARRRANVSGGGKRVAVAESSGFVRDRETCQRHRRQRREDDRSVRIRRARTGRRQRRSQPGRSSATRAAAAAPTASTPKPAWDRPCRRSKAFAPWWAKIICGRSTTTWNYHAGGGEFKDIHVFTRRVERTLR